MHIRDTGAAEISEANLLILLNDAAQEASAAGWWVPKDDDGSVFLATGVHNYDVPADFVAIRELRLGTNWDTIIARHYWWMALDDADDDADFRLDPVWENTYAPAGAAITILTSSVANPTVITTAAVHGLTSGDRVKIVGHTGSTPDINGDYVATVLTTTTFTIPENVTVGGTGGTIAQTLTVKVTGWKRPKSDYALIDTIEPGLEAFLRDRAASHALGFMAAGMSELDRYRIQASELKKRDSEALLQRRPDYTRIVPAPRLVPGR